REGEDERHGVLWTGHFEQLNIPTGLGFLVDGSASFRAAPAIGLQDVLLRLHTEGYHQRANEDFGGVALAVGVARLPAMRYYGLDGGTAMSWSLDFKTTHLAFSIFKN